MLRGKSLTFQRIMEAGYLSAEACSALGARTRLSELDDFGWLGLEGGVRDEVARLFTGGGPQRRLYLLERLDAHLDSGETVPPALLDRLLVDADEVAARAVRGMGSEAFLRECVFVSPGILGPRLRLPPEDIPSATAFVGLYERAFMLWHLRGLLDALMLCPMERAQALGDDIAGLVSGTGFGGVDVVSIDVDVLSLASMGNQRRALYLYGLDSGAFKPFRKRLTKALGPLSVRTFNAVASLGAREFLVNYLFADHGKLQKIPGLGRKSALELGGVIGGLRAFVGREYMASDDRRLDAVIDAVTGNPGPVEEPVGKSMPVGPDGPPGPLVPPKVPGPPGAPLRDVMGEARYSILAREVDSLVDGLGDVRSRNAIRNYGGDFIEDFVRGDREAISLRNVGGKSESLVRELVGKARAVMARTMDPDLSEADVFLMGKRALYGDCLDGFCEEHWRKSGRLPMFRIVGNFIRSRLVDRDVRMLNQVSPMLAGCQGMALEQVASAAGLSCERARQICRRQAEGLRRGGVDVSTRGLDLGGMLSCARDWEYVADRFGDSVMVDGAQAREFARGEDCGLTDWVLVLVLGNMLRDGFEIFGPGSLGEPAGGGRRWRHAYLVSRRVASCFDFGAMVGMAGNLGKDSAEDQIMDAEGLVMGPCARAWRRPGENVLGDVSEVASRMVEGELGLVPDGRGRFTFRGRR